MTPSYAIPIPERRSPPLKRKLFGLFFILAFDLGCLMINGTQFLFILPLKLLPFRWSRGLYKEGIRYTKGAFGSLLILMCQWFAPTKIKLTFESEGQGAFTAEEVEKLVVRNKSGDIEYLDLPSQFVLTANHQVYADWWYAWCLLYFIGPRGIHKDIFITLKKSLRWVPIVGWGMQFFNFIFLARSWASDRLQLASSLSKIGKEAEREDSPFAFVLYPEGTLVSKDTRPISRKFAEKTGIADMRNTLLPRSTGLHYVLRSLAPRMPGVRLIDLTVVYPGIPPMGYGQSYYTLRSIFLDGVPPPEIHVCLRMWDMKELPLGDLSSTNPAVSPDPATRTHTVEVEIPEAEKTTFDLWLRELWREKDDSISRFLETGAFCNSKETVEIPVQLRQKRQILDAFCFFLPASLAYFWKRLRQGS